MENLAKVESLKIATVDKKMIQDYLFTSNTKLSEKQQEMFMQIAVRNNLDPFKREVYAIAYGSEFSIVTGYQVYIERAEASGKLNGWSCENTPEGAKIVIYRKDWEHPFEWEATYEEFDKGQSSWSKMRQFMIKKVCIGQGFRLAFPAELGGMPYLKEEMEGATPFNEMKKPAVRKTQSRSESLAEKQREATMGKEPEEAEGEVVIKVKNITKKETKKNPRYTIWSVDDVGYSTFDKKNADDAKIIEGSDVEALVEFETGKYGNTIKEHGFVVIGKQNDNVNPIEE